MQNHTIPVVPSDKLEILTNLLERIAFARNLTEVSIAAGIARCDLLGLPTE